MLKLKIENEEVNFSMSNMGLYLILSILKHDRPFYLSNRQKDTLERASSIVSMKGVRSQAHSERLMRILYSLDPEVKSLIEFFIGREERENELKEITETT